ncbi:MAG: redoxin domain-containing protein [Candidatus Polarisedimenticolia bacterium]
MAASLVPFACALALVSCSGGTPPDDKTGALLQEYKQMQTQAAQDVRAWKGPGDGPDPRLIWAEKLEAFSAEHKGAGPAADALLGALVLRASRGDHAGFFKAWDQAVTTIPDSTGLPEVFAQVVAMRWAEAGGPGVMTHPDRSLRRVAYKRALPRIDGDFTRLIEAATNPATLAAAHYSLGMAYYQLESDPARALEHFTKVITDYPDAPQAAPARAFAHELETMAVGNPAPDFEITLLDGRTTRLSDHLGRVVLVDFWATWCQPCVDELPGLKNAYASYRARGFTILGISLDEKTGPVRQFLQVHRIRWPVAASGLAMSDPVVQSWGVQQIPMSYLIDRKGIIRGRALFGDDVTRLVRELVER